MIRTSLKFLIDKAILFLWFAIGTAATLLVVEMFNGGIGKAGWMGFVYLGIAGVCFVVIRLLRIVQEWLERPVLEEV